MLGRLSRKPLAFCSHSPWTGPRPSFPSSAQAPTRTIVTSERTSPSFSKKEVGFVGLPVQSAKDWSKLGESAATEVVDIINELTTSSPSPSQVVLGMDRISDLLCRVADPAEFCRNVHPDPAMVRGASQAVMALQRTIAMLNTHQGLYNLSRQVVSDPTSVSQEEFVVINKLKIEFEHNGVHLSPPERDRLLSLQDSLQSAIAQYIESVNDGGDFLRRLRISQDLLARLPLDKERLQKKNRIRLMAPDTYEVAVTESNLAALLDATDGKIREVAYKAYHAPNEFLLMLEEIFRLRQEVAECLGFESYSAMMGWHRVLKTPNEVRDFLESVSKSIVPHVQSDIEEVLKLKRLHEPNSDSPNIFHPWDYKYKNMARKSFRELERQVSEYFTLENTFNGLRILCKTLFDIDLDFVEPSPSEVWHKSVRKMVVRSSSNETLGVIYFDLFPRAGKFSGAANFPLRLRSMHSPHAVIGFVANVCGTTSGRLTIFEVETLFHEFGHTLQNLLTETKLQHVSGSRTYMDFVETPSTLMEYFAFDPRVMPLWARKADGTAISLEDIEEIRRSRAKMAGLTLEDQLFHMMIDNEFHSGKLLKTTTQQIAEEVSSKQTFSKFVPGAPSYSRFSHFVGYGAAYYSYFYSNIHSATIWHRHFEKAPLSPEAGKRYRREILGSGGSREPAEMLKALLGDSTLDFNIFLNGAGVGVMH